MEYLKLVLILLAFGAPLGGLVTLLLVAYDRHNARRQAKGTF